MAKVTNVEAVFKISGVPDQTFIKPSSFNRLKVALRTPGRGVVIEGPSGIGKSTAVAKALEELGIDSGVTMLSARQPGDIEYIELLPELHAVGTVIIDDFHRLADTVKLKISDLLKITADREDQTSKIILIGINDAGKTLITNAPDLANRIDTIRLEVEPPHKILDLISAGEQTLNVHIEARSRIAENSIGSFYIAQLLCLDACIEAGVVASLETREIVDTSYSAISRKVTTKQRERFGDSIMKFARGTRFRSAGRAPYLHILKWLIDSDSWSISLSEEMNNHPTEKASVGQVVDKGYLLRLCEDPEISRLLHFDGETGILSVEDPMLVFYLRSVNWPDFVREVGFSRVDYDENYDVALSFAGEDREYAEYLRDALSDLGHSIFYDQNVQHQMIGENIEGYLGPIYETGSRYVVVVLGSLYGRKRWTLFEAGKYQHRITLGQVIPIWSTDLAPSPTDNLRSMGGLDLNPETDLKEQALKHAKVISQKLSETSVLLLE